MRTLTVLVISLSLASVATGASEPDEGMDLEQLAELMNFGSIRCVTGEPLAVFSNSLEEHQPKEVEAAIRKLAGALNPDLVQALPNVDRDCLGELEYKLAGWVGNHWLTDSRGELRRQLFEMGAEHGEYMTALVADTALNLAQGKISDVMEYMKKEIEEAQRTHKPCDTETTS